MRKIILFFVLLVGSVGFAQTIVEDFDPVRPGSAFFQDNGDGTVGISQVADPAAGGARGNVLRLVTTAGAPWQGAGLILQSSFELDLTDDPVDPDEKKVKMWVYYSDNGAQLNFLAKVTSTTGAPPSATDVTHGGTGWEQLTFDFAVNRDNTAQADGIYSRIVFFPGWRSTNGCTVGCYPDNPIPNITMFIDEISYGSGGGGPIEDVTGDVYINDGTFAAGDFTTAAGQDIATNDGSAAEPFATLDYALARSVQAPGDVIYIDAGTYSWPTTHALTDSGTLANPITIQGKGSNETNITTTAASTTSAGLHFTTGNHWVVKDLNWTATAARAVWVANVDGITLDNCNINMTSTSNQLQSIIIGTAGGELTIKNSTLTRGNTAFHMIEVVEGTTLIMQDNTVSFSALVGSGTSSSVQLRTNASSLFIIERNKFVNGGYGIGNVVGTAGPVNTSSIIKNNFFNSFWGIVTTRVQGLTVHNNSFYTNGESIYGIAPGNLTNWDIRNNILYTYGSSRTCVLSGSTTSHPAIMDYNHYYSPNTGAARQGPPSPTPPILSFTQWRTAPGSPREDNGQGGNAASFNPLYVDAANGDLHLQPGSPAIGAGVDVGITDDIDGDARPLSGSFDMGADEFVSLATCNDGILNNGETSVDCGGPNCSPCTIVLEDFENPIPAGPTGLNPGNGAPQPIIVPDPLVDGVRGDVLQVVTGAAGLPWQQAELTLQNEFIDFTTNIDNNKTVSVDWYSETPFDALIRVDDKVSGPGPGAATAEAAHGGGGWETLVFDFNFQAQNLGVPDGVYRKLFFFNLWDITSGDFLNPNPTGSVASTTYVDTITLFPVNPNPEKCSDGILNNGETEVDCGGPNCVPCETCDIVLGATTTSCDTLQPGTNDDTYTATIDFTGGLGANTFAINASSGTVGGDDPNAVAFGMITITGITEGTDITVTVDNTADGGFCSLSVGIVSPECIPVIETCEDGIQNNGETEVDCGGPNCVPCCSDVRLLENFEGLPPTLNFVNGDGSATVIADPTGGGNGNLLAISTAAGQAPWQQAELVLQNEFLDLTTDKTVSVEWFSNAPFDALLGARFGSGPGPNSSAQASHSGTGWELLVFDFNFGEDGTTAANGTYQQLYFFPLWDSDMPRGGVLDGDGWFLGNPPGTNPTPTSSIATTTYVANVYQGTLAPSKLYTYDNGWLAPGDPSGNSSCVDSIEVISGNVTITADTDIDDVTIQPGASMTIGSGVTVSASEVTLNSTSQQYSSLIVEGALEGTVNYNRYTASVGPVGTNDLIASPVSGQNFGSFATANPNLAASGSLRVFGPYDTNNGTYVNYDIAGNEFTEIVSGIGYRAATADGSPLTFTGTALTGDLLDVPISDASAGSAWNLIGNPYPSYLDFAAFFAANQTQFDADGAFQAIYGYDGSATNGWTVWNSATIADNTVIELIAPGQSFFVKSKTNGGLVDFTTGMRTSGSSDDFILGRSASSLNVALSNLTLTSSANSANTNIYFIEGTTRGLDPGYDAGAYFGASGGFSIFTNLVEDNEGLDMTIQSLPYNDFNDVVIPVGVNASSQGQLTIGLGDNSTVPFNVNVYLEDTLENTLTLLNTSDYTFTSTTNLVGTGRFFLRYSSDTLSLSTNEALDDIIIFTNESQNNIIIKGILTAATQTDLYDIQGRLVLSEKLDQSSITNAIDVSSISSGIYIVQVSNKNSTKTQKLIIK